MVYPTRNLCSGQCALGLLYRGVSPVLFAAFQPAILALFVAFLLQAYSEGFPVAVPAVGHPWSVRWHRVI